MTTRDSHRFSNQLDETTTKRLIDRLESRAKDVVFTRLFDQYVSKLSFSASGITLEIGCGTGAMIRALVHRKDFSGKAIGVDQSPMFIEAARRFAREEGVDELVEFKVGDAHDIDFEDESFDVVIAHTLISHVTDPEVVLREITRVVRKHGSVVIFDGDYATLTYGFPDPKFGRQMDEALASATFSNPLIMRDLSHLLPEMKLEIIETLANVVAEIGTASYFKSFAETFAPQVVSSGLLPKKKVDEWLVMQNHAMKEGTFFASCNYYTYLLRRV